MTTKKKKSAREKRVLIASIITAAMIVTSSTFAWFTSTDDVTNRLTADADYGVSIVESFAPPANWIPGQVVEKDVYAVNTGNIDAYVNEDVQGFITVTYEVALDQFDPTTAVKLNDTEVAETMKDAVTAREGGSFLAWTNAEDATLKPGYIVSSRDEDDYEGAFEPTKPGVYVFRRYIDVSESATEEKYTYDGYYFDGTDYYKIALSEFAVVPETEGVLSSAKVKYIAERTDNRAAVGLQYDELNNRLVATYELQDVNAGNHPTYDAEAVAARNEIDRLEAENAHNKALEKAEDAQEELDELNAVIDARNKVRAEAIALDKLIDDDAEAAEELADATEARDDAKEDAVDALPEFPNSVEASGINTDNTIIMASINRYNDLYAAATGADSKREALVTALNNVQTTTAEAEAALVEYKKEISELYDALAEIKKKAETADIDLEYGTYEEQKQALDEYKAEVNAITLADVKLTVKDYNDAVAKKAATAKALFEDGGNAYNEAVNDYNTLVGEVTSDHVTIPSDYDLAYSDNYFGPTEEGQPVTGEAANGVAANAGMEKVSRLDGSYKPTANSNDGNSVKSVDDLKYEEKLRQADLTAVENRSNDAITADDTITIFVNLDADAADNWTLDPSVPIVGSPNTTDRASFFLNRILKGSETSEKLIDSLELSGETENIFKSFNFDLNIHLDSAQVTYAADQKTITSDAVQGEAWEMTVKEIFQDVDPVAVTWENGYGSTEGDPEQPIDDDESITGNWFIPVTTVPTAIEDPADYYSDEFVPYELIDNIGADLRAGKTIYKKSTSTAKFKPVENPVEGEFETYYLPKGQEDGVNRFVLAKDAGEEFVDGAEYYTKG